MNRILRCPDCNTPLVPGSSSCIKCNKQFSKPIPKVAEPKPAEQPLAPISVTPIATPLKSAYKPQSKALFATVLIVACLIALVTFVITQSQADKRQTLAAEQAYQQALQARAAMIEKASEETPQQQLNDARQKQGEEIQRELAEQAHVYPPAPVATNSQQGSTSLSGTSSQQSSTESSDNSSQQQYQQAENACGFADLGLYNIFPPTDAQEAIRRAGLLDDDANTIEQNIPKVAPGRQDYWTREVANLRRKAEADREDAQALPQSRY